LGNVARTGRIFLASTVGSLAHCSLSRHQVFESLECPKEEGIGAEMRKRRCSDNEAVNAGTIMTERRAAACSKPQRNSFAVMSDYFWGGRMRRTCEHTGSYGVSADLLSYVLVIQWTWLDFRPSVHFAARVPRFAPCHATRFRLLLGCWFKPNNFSLPISSRDN